MVDSFAGAEKSNALFDAMPATEPLVVPAIPDIGTPSKWLPGSTVGSVLETQDANGAVTGFYALLPDGVQKITSFVADLLRTALAQGSATPTLVSPDKLIHIPVAEVLNVGYYPSAKLNFVDTAANPVTCVAWQKQSTDPQATISIFNGRGLPVPISMDPRLVRLVRDDRNPESVEADQALVLPGAANFVAGKGAVATIEVSLPSREQTRRAESDLTGLDCAVNRHVRRAAAIADESRSLETVHPRHVYVE